MEKFRIRVPVTHASGERVYEAVAETFEDAVEMARRGDARCVEEHIEADHMEWEDAEED